MPTVDGAMMKIPINAKFFALVDVENAFPSMIVHKDSRHLLVGVYNKRFYRCIGACQGLAPAAPFWNMHLQDAFNHALDLHWTNMFVAFVDDVLCYSSLEERAELRRRILIAILTVLGKSISPKCDTSVKREVDFVGMTIAEGGHKLSQTGVDALLLTLSIRPKSKDMVRHMLGVILYCLTAFTWNPSRLSWIGEKLHPIRDTLMLPRFCWSEECKTNVKELANSIPNAQLKMRSPDTLLTAHTCFAIKHDASDHNFGYALMICEVADANDVHTCDKKAFCC